MRRLINFIQKFFSGSEREAAAGNRRLLESPFGASYDQGQEAVKRGSVMRAVKQAMAPSASSRRLQESCPENQEAEPLLLFRVNDLLSINFDFGESCCYKNGVNNSVVVHCLTSAAGPLPRSLLGGHQKRSQTSILVIQCNPQQIYIFLSVVMFTQNLALQKRSYYLVSNLTLLQMIRQRIASKMHRNHS